MIFIWVTVYIFYNAAFLIMKKEFLILYIRSYFYNKACFLFANSYLKKSLESLENYYENILRFYGRIELLQSGVVINSQIRWFNKCVSTRGENMCNSLKIGIYGENNDFFGEAEKNVQRLFFNLDLSYDVIYLDNELRIINALDILFVNMGKIIHKASSKLENMLRNAGSYIVAIADNTEELLYAFKIKADTAMLRNTAKNDVVSTLDEVLHDMLKKNKIIVEDDFEKHIIDIEEIMYIESIGDNSAIVTKENSYYCKKSLKYWEDNLSNSGFYRSHKSYMVSVDKIKSINDSEIVFKDFKDKTVPIAVRRKKGLKDLINRFNK